MADIPSYVISHISAHTDRLSRWALTRPNHSAIVLAGSGQTLTYGELWNRGQAVAASLSKLGMARAPIAVLASDPAANAVAALGVELAGGVLAQVAPDLGAAELIATLGFIEARCVIGSVPPEVVGRVPMCAAVLSDDIHVIHLRADAAAISYAVPPDWFRYMLTSGTTGRPKVTILSAAAQAIRDDRWTGLMTPHDTVVSMIKPAADPYLRFVLGAGGTYVAPSGIDPRSAAEAVLDVSATVAVAIPWVFRQWARRPDVHPALRSLRLGIRSGPLALADVEVLYRATGCVAANGYGASEVGGVFRPIQEWTEGKMDSVGRAWPGLELRLATDDGRETGPGEPGELWVRGPGLMEGYLKDLDGTATVMHQGWVRTGDLMTQDTDGYYRIVGRLKSMISVAGRKVYPEEVEQVLLGHPAVSEVAVRPAGDPVRGERVVAFVVLTPGHRVTGAELQAFCRGRLTRYKVPRSIRFVPSLPTTQFGRVSRRTQGA